MKYEVKFTYKELSGDGRIKKMKASLLVEDVSLMCATAEAEKYIADIYADAKYSDQDVTSVTKSTIKEECNPMYFASHLMPQAWTITLEQKSIIEGKEKRMRYPVLLWSNDLPCETSGELQLYLEQMRNGSDEFSVVKITKSPVESCINC